MADDKTPEEKPAAKADHEPPAAAEISATWTGGASPIDYTARASWLVLRKDEKPAAEIFSVSYVAAGDDASRPVMFVFNGGPGASSAFLHLGVVGPQRVAFPADGTIPELPPRLVQNEASWLAFADLVFVDPVGTGFSRIIDDDAKAAAGKDEKKSDAPDPKEYFGQKRDLESLCEFMSRWLSNNGRWGSPIFIAGESYGGYRVGRLVRMLQESTGIGLNGAILISPALEISTLSPSDYDVLAWVDALPTMAAAAAHHGRSRAFAQGTPIDDVLAEAERFATGGYATFLTRGASMGEAEREGILTGLADLVGLPVDMVTRAEGRITIRAFSRALLRDERKVLGLYDATITGTDPFPDRDGFEGPDPTLSGIGPLRHRVRGRDRSRVPRPELRGKEGLEGRYRPALLRAADRGDGRLPLRHVAESANEGVHHARPVRPRHAVLRERPAAEPDAPRPGDGESPDGAALRRRTHVLRLGSEPARLHRRDLVVRRKRDRRLLSQSVFAAARIAAKSGISSGS
jgi:carboxypeptidase C (cathepsin A)